MTSQFSASYRPSNQTSLQLHVEYEVSHHQNRGQDQSLVTKIGTFSKLEEAQRAAQEALRSVLNCYIARGWTGYFCNVIDLEYRGLITGKVAPERFEALSEIHIDAFETIHRPRKVQMYHGDQKLGDDAGYNSVPGSIQHPALPAPLSCSQPPAESSTLTSHPRPDFMLLQTISHSAPTGAFSQTRLMFPNRPSNFIPHPSGQYDETMTLSVPQTHKPMHHASQANHTPAKQLTMRKTHRRHRKQQRSLRHAQQTPGSQETVEESAEEPMANAPGGAAWN